MLSTYPTLKLVDAGTCELVNDVGLQFILKTWQSNTVNMAEVASARGWKFLEPSGSAPATELALLALESSIGKAIPPQLRWALTQSATVQFSWRSSPDDMPRGELNNCYEGGVRDSLWNVDDLVELNGSLETSLSKFCQETSDDDDGELVVQSLHDRRSWETHFGFLDLPNGDILTIDMRNPDPQQQGVYYFCHEDVNPDAKDNLIASNFFSFMSSWTALGCVGSVWFQWQSFIGDENTKNIEIPNTLNTSNAHAMKWLAWLATDPNAPNPEAAINLPPKSIQAKSTQDFDLLKAAMKKNEQGSLKLVKKAVLEGANINCSDNENWQIEYKTAVIHAALNNHIEVLEFLKAHGASFATYLLPLNAVMYKETQAKTILWLINAGARIDRWEGARFCALYGLYKIANHLSDEDYFAILDAMLQKGCDPNAYLDIESSFQKTTLFMQSGLQTQKKLVESGANPILKNIHGGTAMHQAENYEQIQYLQSCGLDINELPPKTEFSYDSRPLHNAMRRDGTCEQAPIDAVEGFLRSGAEPYLLDHSNKNAWWYCRHLETAKILHSYFAFNPNLRDERGNTVVHGIFEWQGCFYHHQIPLFQFYIDLGLDISSTNKNGDTVLHLLCKEYNFEDEYRIKIIKSMLAIGARSDVKNKLDKKPIDLMPKKFRERWSSI